MSDDKPLADDEQLQLDFENKKLKNRIKTAEYNNRMAEHGYKRKPIWFSRHSRERLKKLSRNTSQEKAIEEALIIAEMVAALYPDGSLLEKADRLKARLRAIPRFDESTSDYVLREEADSLIKQRVDKARGKLSD